MLAGTAVYVYAGASVPSLGALADEGIKAVFTARQLTQILIAFALLGLFPLAVRWIVPFFVPKKAKEVVHSSIDVQDSANAERFQKTV